MVDKERYAGSPFFHACTASWQKLNEYHSKAGSVQAIATILDPRCKLQTFKNLGWKKEWIDDAEAALRQIYKDQYMIESSVVPPPIVSTSTSGSTSLGHDYWTAVWGTSHMNHLTVVSEVDMYLEEKVELPQFDPVEWW